MIERFLSYAICRKLTLQDRPTVNQIAEQLVEERRGKKATFRDLIYLIVESLPFRKTAFDAPKRGDAAPPEA